MKTKGFFALGAVLLSVALSTAPSFAQSLTFEHTAASSVSYRQGGALPAGFNWYTVNPGSEGGFKAGLIGKEAPQAVTEFWPSIAGDVTMPLWIAGSPESGVVTYVATLQFADADVAGGDLTDTIELWKNSTSDLVVTQSTVGSYDAVDLRWTGSWEIFFIQANSDWHHAARWINAGDRLYVIGIAYAPEHADTLRGLEPVLLNGLVPQ